MLSNPLSGDRLRNKKGKQKQFSHSWMICPKNNQNDTCSEGLLLLLHKIIPMVTTEITQDLIKRLGALRRYL